jgi:hypothetical protein
MATSIYEALAEAGYAPRSYSGRGMYGSSCVAVVVKAETELLKIGAALGSGLAGEPVRTDSLGFGTVVYWPEADWLPEYGSDDEDGNDED